MRKMIEVHTKPTMTATDLIDHVKVMNPTGRGRPYSIPRLIEIFKIRPTKPKRLTDGMRLELADRFDREGIRYDGLLKEGTHQTRLYCLSTDPRQHKAEGLIA